MKKMRLLLRVSKFQNSWDKNNRGNTDQSIRVTTVEKCFINLGNKYGGRSIVACRCK
jgi:hypothetical protein